jgi:hypothetical protein
LSPYLFVRRWRHLCQRRALLSVLLSMLCHVITFRVINAVLWLPDHPEALASVARSAVTSQASMGVRGLVAVGPAFVGLS